MSVETKSQNIPPPWTVRQALEERTVTRTEWEMDFLRNYERVADKIAETITKEVLEKIHQQITDGYWKVPTSSQPFKKSYSFDVSQRSRVSSIQKWAQETAEFPPFKEWFAKLNPSQEIGSFMGSGSEQEASSLSLIQTHSIHQMDMEYFQSHFDDLGARVRALVEQKLNRFKERNENRPLTFEVEWYGRPSVFSSTTHNHSIHIALSITQDVPEHLAHSSDNAHPQSKEVSPPPRRWLDSCALV